MKIGILRHILLIALAAAFLGLSDVRAENRATDGQSSAANAIADLIDRLENVDDRQRLIRDLSVLQEALQDEATGQETAPPNVLNGFLENLAGQLARAGDDIASLTSQVGNPSEILNWISEQASSPERRSLWLSVVMHVVLIVGAALFAALLLGRLLRRPRSWLENHGPVEWYRRLPLVLARTVLAIIPVIALVAVGYGALAFGGPEHLVYGVVLSVVHAIAAARIFMALAGALVTPFNSGLRLLPMTDETAAYVFIWLRRLVNVPVYGFFVAQIALTLGLPVFAWTIFTKLVGLAETILLMVLILQVKDQMARTLGPVPGAAISPVLAGLRRRLADVWHYLATLYVLTAFIIWAVEIEGGFAFVATGTGGSLLVIALAIGARYLADSGLQRLFRVSDRMRQRYPVIEARANRYLPAAKKTLALVIWLIAALLILRVWQFDVGASLVIDFGRLIVSRTLNIALILALTLAVWEGISTVITVYLERTDQDGNLVEQSARVRTLLPLARNALLVVILTMAILTTLSELGINIAPLLAGAGVIGLAIGFGAQTLVKDIITGAFILIENSIAIGDYVSVGSLSGTVEGMTIRTIRLRDPRGTVHTIPFSAVDTVTNKTRDFAWHIAEVGVAYKEDIDEVYEVLREIGAELQANAVYGSDVLEPITIDGVDALADSAVVVRARLKTKPGAQWRIKRIFNDLLKRRFDERGIEIPYPHQTIYFGEDKKGNAPSLRVRGMDDDSTADDRPKTAAREKQALASDAGHRDAGDDGGGGGV